ALLAIVCVVLGVAPMVVVPLLDRVVTPFASVSIEGKVLALDGWALAPVNVEFSSLSPPVLALLLVALSMLALGLVVAFGGLVRKRYTRLGAAGSTSRLAWSTLRPGSCNRSSESSVRSINRP